jgi:hypothetical protein
LLIEPPASPADAEEETGAAADSNGEEETA